MLKYIKQHPWLKLILIFVGATLLTVIVRAGTTSPVDSYAACIEAGNPVLQTDPPICRDGARNFTGTPAPSPQISGSSTSVAFELLVDGDTKASVPSHRQDFINSTSQWQAYWREVHSGLATLPPLIPVDFNRSDVVAVSLGEHATTGFGLKITGVSTGSAGTTVDLTESSPTITCSVAQAITNRYVIVRTPKLAAPVSFRITSEKRHCP